MENCIFDISRCPICGIEETQTIGINRMFQYDSEVLECQFCKFCWLKRQLDDDGLHRFYDRLYRNIKRESLDRSREIGDLLRSRSQLNYFRDHIEGHESILEIGAGYGINAGNLWEQGFKNITVNEFDLKSLKDNISGKIHIESRPFVEMEEDSFDLIILSHVIEHFYDIEGKVLKIKGLLKEKGRIFIEVPNNVNKTIRKDMSNVYHYLFFSKRNLIELFKKMGFHIIKCNLFGKDRLIGSLSTSEFCRYEEMALNDDAFDDIIEMEETLPNAFWIRILVQK